MTIKELTIGMEGIIDGWRWVQVEELIDNGSTAWAVDQDGESHEICLGDFDHIFNFRQRLER